MCVRIRHGAVLILVAWALAACSTRQARVASPEPADDYVDQEAWASVQADGPGSTTSSGFYGVGPSPSPDVHEPASARPGGHQPY